TDAEASLATAFVGGPGILVSAGTGSIAYARDPGGRLHSSGGHGWQVGDEGGGYWLGRRALAAAARAHEGRGEATTLLATVLTARWGVRGAARRGGAPRPASAEHDRYTRRRAEAGGRGTKRREKET